MPTPTILACLIDKGRSARLLDIARQVVASRGGRLIGAYAGARLVFHPGQLGAARLENQRRHEAELARANERLFRAATDGDLFSSEWRHLPSTAYSAQDTMMALVRTSDLVVADLLAPSLSERPFGGVVETFVLQGGRPVLLLPEGATAGGEVCERAMVAWDGSRESARAVFDSLPLLRAARTVSLVSIEEPGDSGASPGHSGDAMHETLAHHGIEGAIESIARDGRGTGEALLAHAAETEATMLVMGAYGHARWREFTFGGATRHVLRHAALPVFVSN